MKTCKGKNCSSDGVTPHSSECRFEHAQAIASGIKSVRLEPYTGPWYEEQDRLRREEMDPGCHAREEARLAKLKDGDKDWETPCQNCGEKPTVHPVQLCGPCCFGEAKTFGGNW